VVWSTSFLVVCVMSFDMFRRWYFVVCMVCFFLLGVGALLFVCNCSRVVVVCDTVIYVCI